MLPFIRQTSNRYDCFLIDRSSVAWQLLIVPLFFSNQSLKIHFRGKEVEGQLLFEKAREAAIRIDAVRFNEVLLDGSLLNQLGQITRLKEIRDFQQVRDILTRDQVHVEYRQHNYHCSFDTRLLEMEPDRSCRAGSLILNLEIPGKVRRVLKASGAEVATAST
ncbi:MAG: hypothetical protein KDK30_15050 [Leptospiraceae bacterium]|nr:hypothetical protein [Leptospiraceae bacterium]MCB1318770.1 hypothetical protein [Leptospiraceae bacterium]